MTPEETNKSLRPLALGFMQKIRARGMILSVVGPKFGNSGVFSIVVTSPEDAEILIAAAQDNIHKLKQSIAAFKKIKQVAIDKLSGAEKAQEN